MVQVWRIFAIPFGQSLLLFLSDPEITQLLIFIWSTGITLRTHTQLSILIYTFRLFLWDVWLKKSGLPYDKANLLLSVSLFILAPACVNKIKNQAGSRLPVKEHQCIYRFNHRNYNQMELQGWAEGRHLVCYNSNSNGRPCRSHTGGRLGDIVPSDCAGGGWGNTLQLSSRRIFSFNCQCQKEDFVRDLLTLSKKVSLLEPTDPSQV